MRISHFSHIGQREKNQDRCAVFRSNDGRTCLLVVADGLGGHSGGSIAAETVVDTAKACWEERHIGEDAEVLLRRLTIACHRAVKRAGRDSGLDPHSTLAALVLEDDRAVSSHVGDSRVMQFSRNGYVERTLDHSAAQLLVLEGRITEEEMATHPDQSIVFSQIGGARAPEPAITEWNLAAGERFVICSDGFWEVFPSDEICELFTAGDPAAEARRRLEMKLERLRKHDNATAIFAETETARKTKSILHRWTLFRAGGTPLSLACLALVVLVVGLIIGPNLPALAQESGTPTDATTDLQTEAGENGRPEEGVDAAPSNSTDGVSVSDSDGEASATEGKPVPLDDVSIEDSISIGAAESAVQAAEVEIRRRGGIGNDDSLVPLGDPRRIGDSVFTRAEQIHGDIPVFAAEVVIRTVGDRIVSIRGDSAADIELPTGLPEHDYPSTLDLASAMLGEEITAWDDGSRVVFALPDGHRLGWLGMVTIGDAAPEDVVFDAADGALLFRVPAVLDGDWRPSCPWQESAGRTAGLIKCTPRQATPDEDIDGPGKAT